MIIKPEFVQLYEPLFLAGMNFGLKLTPSVKGGIKMEYDDVKDILYIVYKDKMALIKTWASMTIDAPGVEFVTGTTLTKRSGYIERKEPTMNAQVSGPGIGLKSAQVSTPMDKVQGKPGRKAKFQGEEAE